MIDKIARLDTLITHLEEHIQELKAEREELSLYLLTPENIARVTSWGWTQQAMAEYFCVSQPTIHRWKRRNDEEDS